MSSELSVNAPLDSSERTAFRPARVNTQDLVRGVIKRSPDDFYVEELIEINLSGEGEHLYLFIEKVGQNTEYLAKQLARHFGVRTMDVGFSGLKDRWAVTRQWFSVYIRNRQFTELDLSEIEGVTLIESGRHHKKLRRGEHYGNRFRIVIRDVDQPESLEPSLLTLQKTGYPNYFGTQRFGHEAQNLVRAMMWFRGEIKASRSQRSFYLSAVRSYLFNVMLSERVLADDWLEGEGPLYGDPAEGVQAMTEQENAFFERYPELVRGLHKNRMTLARRPYRMLPENMSWSFCDDSLQISFNLASGAFATSLLAEFCEIEDAALSRRSPVS